MENAAAPADSAKKSRRFMEKASKKWPLPPKTSTSTRLHRLPKRVNGHEEAVVRAGKLWQEGNSFAGALAIFSPVDRQASSPHVPQDGFLENSRRPFCLTWPAKTGSKTGSEGQQHHFHDRGRSLFWQHPHLAVGFERD